MNKFIEIDPAEIQGNPFAMIGKEWMLITAGQPGDLNTMTASWGGVGIMWNVPVAAAVVRPSRYTYEFLEREKYYSLSFLDSGCRRALQICGSRSGRDCNKVEEAGLTPRTDAPAPYFDEARLVLICRKNYVSDLKPEQFLDPTIETHYTGADYHRLYLGEIVKVLLRLEER